MYEGREEVDGREVVVRDRNMHGLMIHDLQGYYYH